MTNGNPRGMNAPAPSGALYTEAPINDICPSPTNPRRRFDEAYLKELAESIKSKGVVAPITLRPNPKGKPACEIVVGECRWRAAKLAGLATIPALVREFTDEQVLEIQIIENLQRRDVHPLEEAAGYQALMKKANYTAEQIGDKVCKSEAYIYARLKLLACTPKTMDAFYEGKLDASRALLIARIPTQLQDKALGEILDSRHEGGELSYRQAKDHIHEEYMLLLKDAPFSRDDAALVPKCGACGPCPKRTGNQRDLFSDVKSADICTDPTCFKTKVDAHVAKQRTEAKARGLDVIEGKRLQQIAPQGLSASYGLNHLKDGLIALDAAEYIGGKRKTFRELLGKSAPAPTALLIDPNDKSRIIEVVDRTAMSEAFKAKGIEAPWSSSGSKRTVKSATEKASDAKLKQEGTYRGRLFIAVRQGLIDRWNDPSRAAFTSTEIGMIAERTFNRLDFDNRRRVVAAREGPAKGKRSVDGEQVYAFGRRVDKMDAGDQARLILECLVVDESVAHEHSSSQPTDLVAMAETLKIDPAAIKAEVIAELRDKGKKKPAAKKPETKSQQNAAKMQPAAAVSKVAAAAHTDRALQIGDRVRVLDNVRSPLGRPFIGKSGVVTGRIGECFLVRPDGLKESPSFHPSELQKLIAAPDAPRAAQARGSGATTPAAPAGGKTPKAGPKAAKAKTDPAPALPANEPANAAEASGEPVATPVKTAREAWPFPTASRPVVQS